MRYAPDDRVPSVSLHTSYLSFLPFTSCFVLLLYFVCRSHNLVYVQQPTHRIGNHVVHERVYVCLYGQHFQQGMDQPGKVVNPARGQLSKENIHFPGPSAPYNLVSRDGSCHSASVRSLSILERNLMLALGIPFDCPDDVHM